MNIGKIKIKMGATDSAIRLVYNGHEAKLTETVLINIVKLNAISKHGAFDWRANNRILNFLLRNNSSHAPF